VENKFYASCLVFGSNGEQLAHYQKIHLFDVQVADGTGNYLESKSTEPGNKVVVFDTDFGRIGVAICYDLRFPGLFQKLAELGAEAVVLPSAFTQKTGEAHWQMLLQARAVENQFYMIGCNQSGRHLNGRETYGHSMVVDPWGRVIGDAGTHLGLVTVKIDSQNSQQIREKMPVRHHNRFETQLRRNEL
jgi:nitrilase